MLQHAARQIIEAWRIDYNHHRPHTSLRGLTPNEFATRSTKDHTENRVLLSARAERGQRQRVCIQLPVSSHCIQAVRPMFEVPDPVSACALTQTLPGRERVVLTPLGNAISISL